MFCIYHFMRSTGKVPGKNVFEKKLNKKKKKPENI